ncbi:MAG: ester cyclase [Polyangiaceae bacterium]
MTPADLDQALASQTGRAILDVFAGHAPLAKLDELVHAEHELHQNLADFKPIKGREKFARLVGFYHSALSDWQVAIEDEVWDQRAVVYRLSAAATHSGPLGLIRATNKRIEFSAVLTVEFLGHMAFRTTLFAEGISILRQMEALELVDPCPEGASTLGAK